MKLNETVFTVCDYDLAATLGCGQAFRWERRGEEWHGVVGEHAVALEQRHPFLSPSGVKPAQTAPRSRRYEAAAIPENCEGPAFTGAATTVIVARTALPQTDWRWLEDYLQIQVDLPTVLATFPEDEPMRDRKSTRLNSSHRT